MSRQVDVAVQTGDLDTVVINHDVADFTCLITGQILFDPIVTHCGQHFERSASAKLQRCPCCNEPNIQFNEPSAFFKIALEKTIQQFRLYENVYFDLVGFKQVVAENQLNTPKGVRFLTLLQNSASYLNNKELIRTETQVIHHANLEIPRVIVVETLGKSPIEILAEIPAGRDLLRKKLKIEEASGKYFFGNAEISPESLQIQVNGKSIREWLSITTAMEIALDEAQKAREAIDVVVQTTHRQLQTEFSRAQLFLLQDAQGDGAAGQRISSDAVNSMLRRLVYGHENAMKGALEAVKSNPTQLSSLLSDTGSELGSFGENLVTGSAAGVGMVCSTSLVERFKKYCPIRQFGDFKPYPGSLLFAVNIVPTTAIQWATAGALHCYMPENAVFAQQLAASAFCGVTGALIATPVENSITRQQMMKAGAKATVQDMMSQGMLRPWKTYHLVAARDAIFTMWMMSILPAVKVRTKDWDWRSQWLANFGGSALGAAASHPFDAVATNIQKYHDPARAAAVTKELFLKEGVRAFYRGYSSRLFLFFSFSNGIPVFKQTADYCIYGRGELPERMRKVTNFAGSLFAKASHTAGGVELPAPVKC